MITITVCVGSSCFVRGAPRIVEEFQNLIATLPPGSADLRGTFCMEKCTDGVTVKIGDKVFTAVTLDTVQRLFDDYVRSEVKPCPS
ncbi:MAG: NAD(P)H-dependent oxidoreductase subunit E [Bacillota bacterium]